MQSAVFKFFRAALKLLLLGFSVATFAQSAPSTLTNLFQLQQAAEHRPFVLHPFRAAAEVLDADTAGGGLLLSDSSGVEFVNADFHGQKFEPGMRVLLEGNGCGITRKDFGLALIPGLVVDNDGTHAMMTESGRVYLHAGANPISLFWFNRAGGFGLTVEYQGPGLPRQVVPNSVLSISGNSGPVTNGLHYRGYEGIWQSIPNLANLQPVKTGQVQNFDLGVRSRDVAVGLEFEGWITVPHDGIYIFHVSSDDGSRLFVGESSLEIRPLSRGPATAAHEGLPANSVEGQSRSWVALEGKVNFAGAESSGGEMLLSSGKKDIRVVILDGDGPKPRVAPDSLVRVSGLYEEAVAGDGSPGAGVLLALSWNSIRPAPDEHSTSSSGGTTVASIASVKALTPEQASQRRPVSIRGVITAVMPPFIRGVVIQDATKGIYVSVGDTTNKSLERGDFCQVDGVTGPGLFAPVINAQSVTRLGTGVFPSPIHANWDQLINGTLDTQYAEIEGIVTAVHGRQISVLADGGKIALDLSDFPSENLAACLDGLVCIRGCAFANFNGTTHELDTTSLRVMGAAVEILRGAPADLFDAPRRDMRELHLYDPNGGTFQRLKVGGQILCARGPDYYLSDGSNGLIVTSKTAGTFGVGDLVEAVGFLELGGAAAELKESALRKIGQAPLPKPMPLPENNLLVGRYAGNLVQLEATLMNHWVEGADQVLEAQSGFVAFRARLAATVPAQSLPPTGSKLQLTGVYVPRGTSATDGSVSGFELLLNSLSNIHILATPPWWNLRRVLILSGILTALLFGVLIWNTELQRKVQERGSQLEAEIRTRRQAELQQAAEAERARIARDLHDELGTGLTEVSLLANAGAGRFRDAEESGGRFRTIADKARALVTGLDVIVWAIDPKRNSVQSLADYVGRYATELFAASGIVCRFKIPIECGDGAMTESARHSLFLAVKEALNNVIRHSSATEVKIQMKQTENQFEIVIADNGRGFNETAIQVGNGLANLRARLEALHGQCHITSRIAHGTTIQFVIPLPSGPAETVRSPTSKIV